MKSYDVGIFSKHSQGLFLAQKLTAAGLKVLWYDEDSSAHSRFSHWPWFLGVYPDLLDSTEYQTITNLYHAIQAPLGLSLMTSMGPFELNHLEVLDYQKNRFEWGPEGFDQKILHWVSELQTCSLELSNLTTTPATHQLLSPYGSFNYLYPKHYDLDFESLLPGVDHKKQLNNFERTKNGWSVDGCFVQSAVWAGYASDRFKSFSRWHKQPGFNWYRARLDVGNLWQMYKGLPVWSYWRMIEEPLPLYDALFVLQRVFDDVRVADVYFRLPEPQPRTGIVNYCLEKIQEHLARRMKGMTTQLLSSERLPFALSGRHYFEQKEANPTPGFFICQPELADGLSFNHQLLWERRLAADIQTYLKKVESKKGAL